MGRKTTLWIFQATNKRSLTRENLDVAKKGKPFLIATQNNAIRTNYIKARIDEKHQTDRCMLFGD